MFRYPIAAGDTVYVPGGILHAFGPDTLIFEVQQTSDLGQSVMPTDLYGNRLSDEQWRANIDATLAELKTDYLPRPHPGLDKPLPRSGQPHHRRLRRPLLRARALAAERAASRPGPPLALPDPLQRRRAGDHRLERRRRNAGPSGIDPAARRHRRRHALSPTGAEADLIACYLPDLQRDIVEPLRAAGHSDDAIRALGEVNL